MNRIIFSLITIIIIAFSCTHSTQPAKKVAGQKQESSFPDANFAGGIKPANRLFPDKLRDLPNEITASHFPNPCYATYEDSMYIWKHNTSLQASEDLQIIEYGSFVFTAKGWYLRVTMTPDEFEKSYNCKGAMLKKRVVYTDTASWRRSDKLQEGDAMWYYIAKDKTGRLVKGIAPIETEAKLLHSTMRTVTVKKAEMSWTGYGEIGGYSLSGSLQLKKGEVLLSGDTLKGANIIFNMQSITHADKNLQEHLRGRDFFEVATFPEASFKTTDIQYKSTVAAVAKGTLTIKGITKPIIILLQIDSKQGSVILNGKTSVDRTLFGIKYNSKSFFGNLGDQAIKNNFDLQFKLTL